MMLGAIFTGYVMLHQQAHAKPWNYPPGFVSDFHENIENNDPGVSGQYTQVNSRRGLAQSSQGDTKTEINKE